MSSQECVTDAMFYQNTHIHTHETILSVPVLWESRKQEISGGSAEHYILRKYRVN